MAKYTMQLNELIEKGVELFKFDYDFYDNDKKDKLQEDFIQHFYFHEIGSETIEKFCFRLKRKWLEVIEKYSNLFEANERIKNDIDILANYKTESKVVFHDTPKGEITFDSEHATNFTTTNTSGYMSTTASELLKNYNQNYINIQEEFFNEFSSLFMQIY